MPLDISIYMATQHIEDIGRLYSENIAPLLESETVGQLPTDTIPHVDSKTSPDSAFTTAGPESAENFEPSVNDTAKKKKKESAYNEDSLSQPLGKNQEKAVKREAREINNSTMKENNKKSNKSAFDSLFEDVMKEDFDALVPEDDFGGEEDLGDDIDIEGGDEGGDLITLELPREMAEELHGKLGELLGGMDEEGGDEDFDLEDDLGDEEELPESHVDLQNAPDSVSKLATANGGNNKVGGHATPVGGSADSSSAGQEDGGKPRAQADGVGKLATKNGGNNKVGGKITGGGKHMFKA